MPGETFFGHPVFVWIILPLLIFLARVADVTLGTLRIVFVSKGLKRVAPLVGFLEVSIWLMAIRTIMQNLDNIACFFAYSAGFAMGTYIGLNLENKLALGNALLRVVSKKDASGLVEHLRGKGFGVTCLEAEGKEGKVHVFYMIIRRNDFADVAACIHRFNPQAFYSLEDVQVVRSGTFPNKRARYWNLPFFGPFRFWRKGK